MNATAFAGRESDKFIVRFPKGMRAEIKRRAADNGRSMNAEIIFHLRKALGLATGAVVGAETPAAEDDEAAQQGGSL